VDCCPFDSDSNEQYGTSSFATELNCSLLSYRQMASLNAATIAH
jgi:hypothetical protein